MASRSVSVPTASIKLVSIPPDVGEGSEPPAKTQRQVRMVACDHPDPEDQGGFTQSRRVRFNQNGRIDIHKARQRRFDKNVQGFLSKLCKNRVTGRASSPCTCCVARCGLVADPKQQGRHRTRRHKKQPAMKSEITALAVQTLTCCFAGNKRSRSMGWHSPAQRESEQIWMKHPDEARCVSGVLRSCGAPLDQTSASIKDDQPFPLL